MPSDGRTTLTTRAGDTVRLAEAEVRDIAAQALVRSGAVPAEAVVQAAHLTEADLRGHASHGVRRIPVLAGRLKNKVTVSGAAPRLTWRTDAVLEVDGHRGFGPVVAGRVIEALTARVGDTGVALATISNTGHLGMLAPYLERIAASGNAAVMLTVSEALVHAWGGSEAVVGTNPVGIAVPSLADPLILDMSTAQVSAGRILDYASRGEPLPDGWAVDERGRPTTDAHAATRGALSPFGGAKGYALGIALEALVGVLTGGAFGRDVHGTLDEDMPPTKGDALMVFSVDRLGASSGLQTLARYLDDVRSSGTDGSVSIPGERARQERARRSIEGIPLDRALWGRLRELAGAGNA